MLFHIQAPDLAKGVVPIEEAITPDDQKGILDRTLFAMSDAPIAEVVRAFLCDHPGSIIIQSRATDESKALSDEALSDVSFGGAFWSGSLHLQNECLWRWPAFDRARIFIRKDKVKAFRNAIAPGENQASVRPVSQKDLLSVLFVIADGTKSVPLCRAESEAHFGRRISEKPWRDAWGKIPTNKKLGRGRPKETK
jgi:hypothetical protein